MIDIHNHALFGVDDGAKTLPESMAMLKEAKEQGIQALILTPHYRHGMFSFQSERGRLARSQNTESHRTSPRLLRCCTRSRCLSSRQDGW